MVVRKMLARLSILTLFFLIASVQGDTHSATEVEGKNGNSFYALLEDKLEIKIGEFVNYFTKWLADFNDRHLGTSTIGRLIHYDDIKPALEEDAGRSKMGGGRMKKMSMAMMPLVFHVGATSTWMLITSLMAAKSVAIGMALLIFKIAVSSAKLASFFTLLKGKHGDHHGWSWSPPPHYEHHGHERSFNEIEQHISPTGHQAWHSYSPEWTPETQEYHTIPTNYHRGEIDAPYPKAEDRKKKLP